MKWLVRVSGNDAGVTEEGVIGAVLAVVCRGDSGKAASRAAILRYPAFVDKHLVQEGRRKREPVIHGGILQNKTHK